MSQIVCPYSWIAVNPDRTTESNFGFLEKPKIRSRKTQVSWNLLKIKRITKMGGFLKALDAASRTVEPRMQCSALRNAHLLADFIQYPLFLDLGMLKINDLQRK